MTHTATPWTHRLNIGILGPDGREIARTIVPEVIPVMVAVTEAYDNAAYIVHACNAHANLLDALEAMVEAADGDSDDEQGFFNLLGEAMVKARAAIAKAVTP